jgi:hypothetical protein
MSLTGLRGFWTDTINQVFGYTEHCNHHTRMLAAFYCVIYQQLQSLHWNILCLEEKELVSINHSPICLEYTVYSIIRQLCKL